MIASLLSIYALAIPNASVSVENIQCLFNNLACAISASSTPLYSETLPAQMKL